MAEEILLQDFFDDEVLEIIEKQSEYLQKLPIEPTVANLVYILTDKRRKLST